MIERDRVHRQSICSNVAISRQSRQAPSVYTFEGMTVGALLIFLGLLGPSMGYKPEGTRLHQCYDKERGVMPSGYNETTKRKRQGRCRQGYCITGEHSSTTPDDAGTHELTTPQNTVKITSLETPSSTLTSLE
nr:uncharacterized protein LOC126525186 isoform X3 [Dermacentor andersoni]